MNYLLAFTILLLLFSCGKDPKPQPVVTKPAVNVDTFLLPQRKFTGEYVMFDSTEHRATSNYPPFPPEHNSYKISRIVTLEIDSINEMIVLGRDTFRREGPTSKRYSRRLGPPRYWEVTEDSTTLYFWGSRPGHIQVGTYVSGYRKK